MCAAQVPARSTFRAAKLAPLMDLSPLFELEPRSSPSFEIVSLYAFRDRLNVRFRTELNGALSTYSGAKQTTAKLEN